VRRLRILFLLPFPPRADARHGGSRTMWHFLSNISSRHSIAILYLRTPGEPDIDDSLRRRCEFVGCAERPQKATMWQRMVWHFRLLASVLRGIPMWVTDWHVRAFANLVSDTCNEWRPDVVQIEFHVMGQYIQALRGNAPRLLVLHEPGTEAAQSRRDTATGLRKLIYWKDVIAWRNFERSIFGAVDTVVTFTERDKRGVMESTPRSRIVAIRPGSVSVNSALDPAGTPGMLLFAGSFRHYPNVEAATRLIGKIVPSVRIQEPQTVLYIVGQDFPDSLKHEAGSGIIITGPVPDVMPYLDRAALILAPLSSGGGIRVKVLEALAAGKAVVGSRLSAEGLDVSDGEHIVFAETDEEFAVVIVDLLRDPERRVRIATSARTWAAKHLDWSDAMSRLDALYDDLLCARDEKGSRVRSVPELDN
jgi:polysaccharide biosynthesis protein PslH